MVKLTRFTTRSVQALAGSVRKVLRIRFDGSIQSMCFGLAIFSAFLMPVDSCIAAASESGGGGGDAGGGEGDGDSADCDGGDCGGGQQGGDPNDEGEGEVCRDESDCDDCGSGDKGEPPADAGDPGNGNHPVNWETGEKWETISDLVVAVSGKDFRLTRQYSSDPAYSSANMYSGVHGVGTGMTDFVANPTVGANWAFSNLRGLTVKDWWDCQTVPCDGNPPTTRARHLRTTFAVLRPGRKPRAFTSPLEFGVSADTMPGNQRIYAKNDSDFSRGTPSSLACGDDICGYTATWDGVISGNIVFEDPGKWSQEFEVVDSLGFIVDDIDAFGNRRYYKKGTNGLPQYIYLNGGGDEGGHQIWGDNTKWADEDMAEARIELFWETIGSLPVLARAEVERPTSTGPVLTQYVEYYHIAEDGQDLVIKYHDGTSYSNLQDPSTSQDLLPSLDLGVAGDLVQVVRYRAVDPDATTITYRSKVQQYRYHDGVAAPTTGDIRLRTQGEEHQLKMSIAPQQIEYIAQQTSTATSPTTDALLDEAAELLALDDDESIGTLSTKVYESAQKIISYEGVSASTDNPVEFQFLLAASCGCGSPGTQSAVLLEYEQFDDWEYDFLPGFGTDNVPGQSMHIKEFALSSFTGWPTGTQDRTYCYDLLMLGDNNQYPYKWVTATLEGDGSGSNRAWVNRVEYDRDDRVVTGRTMPSAFASYTKAGTLTAPSFTMNSGDGLVAHYSYANENVSETEYSSVGGTRELVREKTYVTHTDPDVEVQREHLVAQGDYYRVAGSTAANDIETVQYDYGWEDENAASPRYNYIKRTEEREIEDENGPTGTNDVESWTFFDDWGRVIWEVDPEGTLTRYEYDPVHGNLVKRVENSQSPDELTLPSSESDPLYATMDELVEPTSNSPFPSTTGSDGELVYEYKRDILGRLKQSVYPGGVTRTIVREMREDSERPGILYFAKTYLPHLASGSTATPKVYNGPAVLRIMDATNKPLRTSTYELDVTGTYTPDTVTDFDTIAGDELSRVSQVLDLSGSADSTEQWWDVSADESYISTREYDAFGRMTKFTDPNGTVSERVYDAMDRVIEVKVGTTTSSPETVVEYIYDGDSGTTSTMDQGVGNGNLTGVLLHDGDSGTRLSRIYYDHRDRQIAVVLPDAPMELTRFDNLDRPIESAVYPEPTTAPTTANIRTLAAASLPTSDTDLNLPSGELRAWYTKTHYSQRGYVWQEQTAIDPTDSMTEFLEWNAWYDDEGNELASWGANSPKIVSEYDAHDRVTKLMVTDRAGDVSELSYADVIVASDDVVLEQAEYEYEDGSGLLEMITSRMRVHDDTSAGLLDGTNSVTTYMGYAYDEAQRVVGVVDFGTNKTTGNPFSKTAGSVPTLTSFDTLDELRQATGVLFGWRTYNTRGMIEDIISIQDGTGVSDLITSRYLYDDMYRTVATVENADAISLLTWDGTEERYTVSGFDHTKQDTDRVTSFVYDGVSNIVKRVAHIPEDGGGSTTEGVQVTEYVYGVASGSSGNAMDSLLASKNILKEVRYPDESTGEASSAATNKVQYAYNRLGELRGLTDQNGTLRTFGHDEQGRVLYDKVNTLGTFSVDGSTRTVDGAVRRLGYSYDSLGRMQSIASFTDTTGTTYRDEVQMGYTPLWQIETVTQQHDGAVDSSSAQVLYRYESEAPSEGDHNYSRLTDIVYPTDNDGNSSDQTVQYTYASGVEDRLSRINKLGVMQFKQSSGTGSAAIQNLVSYKRIGLGMLGKATIHMNNSIVDSVTLDRTAQHDGAATPAGTYPALDKFGRVTRHMWVPDGFGPHTTATGFSNKPAVVEITHTYDRSSNRLSYNDAREGAKLPGRNRAFEYDRLNRLVEEARSSLPAAAGYTPQHHGHQWALDMLGNWDDVLNDADDDGVFTDNQGVGYLDDRAANSANEISDSHAQYDRRMLESGTTPIYYDYHYDDTGNLTDQRTGSTLPLPPGTLQDGRQHTYDAWNRLVKSEMRTTGGTVFNTIAEYTYNALGWRTTKKMDTATGAYDGTLDQERTFYYGSSWRILEEHVDSDLSSSSDDVWISQEFWGTRYIDDSVAKRIDRGGTGDWSSSNSDLTHWFRVTDSQFSVVGVLNDDGVMHERISYDAYGNAAHRYGGDANGDGAVWTPDIALPGTFGVTIDDTTNYHADLDMDCNGTYEIADYNLITGSIPMNTSLPNGWISDPSDSDGPDNSVGYAGYVFNAEREDYSVRYRVYSPELGRWMQRDPIGYLGGGNLYGYSWSSPLMFVDPEGLSPQPGDPDSGMSVSQLAECERLKKQIDKLSDRMKNRTAMMDFYASVRDGTPFSMAQLNKRAFGIKYAKLTGKDAMRAIGAGLRSSGQGIGAAFGPVTAFFLGLWDIKNVMDGGGTQEEIEAARWRFYGGLTLSFTLRGAVRNLGGKTVLATLGAGTGVGLALLAIDVGANAWGQYWASNAGKRFARNQAKKIGAKLQAEQAKRDQLIQEFRCKGCPGDI